MLNFKKVHDVKSPCKAHESDAGIDFFVPEKNMNFLVNFKDKNPSISIVEKGFLVGPHERVLIPSGVCVEFLPGHVLIAFNKSGVSSGKGLDTLACVVDQGYTGQVHVSLVNTSNETVQIDFGSKITQFVLLPIVRPTIREVEELQDCDSSRGAGGFGSSGV